MSQAETTHPAPTVLPWEDAAAYTALREGLLAAYTPQSAHEIYLVEELVEASWAWRRARAVETAFWEEIGGSHRNGPAGIAEALFQESSARFNSFFRYMQAAERRYGKALQAVARTLGKPAARAVAAPAEPAATALPPPCVSAEPLPAAAAAGRAFPPAGGPPTPAVPARPSPASQTPRNGARGPGV